jgi:hypothetical protein
MSKEISLKILLQNPIDGIVYGLQKGKGPGYEIVQAQPGKGRHLAFDFVVQVKQADGSVISLSGPFVQGTPGNRFVYINIGSYAGQAGASWSGRLKVPLSEADFQNTFTDGGEYYWSCTVPGRTGDGKPVFATVKPFSGWSKLKLSN